MKTKNSKVSTKSSKSIKVPAKAAKKSAQKPGFDNAVQFGDDIAVGNRGEVVRIRRVLSKNGDVSVDIRKFYLNEDSELAPGKGIYLPGDALEAVLDILNDLSV